MTEKNYGLTTVVAEGEENHELRPMNSWAVTGDATGTHGKEGFEVCLQLCDLSEYAMH